MTPELWQRLKPLFRAALDIDTGQRMAFIQEACGDDQELRENLVKLVEAAQESTQLPDGVRPLTRFFDSSRFNPDELLLERFRIIRHIGSGGMGEVYEAWDLELSQVIALKTIRPELSVVPAILSRFKKELQLARRIGGTGICRVYELFVSSFKGTRIAFFTMEFLDGVTLHELICETGRLSWQQAQPILQDIFAGLSAMHQAGIVHRDLKSRNIMLVEKGGAKHAVLMDFGLAHESVPVSAADETALTAPGVILGTPEYMAPEQFEGKEVSAATDIYAMGVLIYEMFTGKHPFAAHDALGAAVMRAKRTEPVSSVQKGLPHRLDMVIRKCLEYEPRQRYQSVNELCEALRGNTLRLGILRPGGFRALAAGFSTALILLCLLFLPAVRERVQGIFLSSYEKHIAVLPFDIGGNSQETVALGTGLMDSLSGKLSNLDSTNASLWVVPASEVRRRKVNNPLDARREFGATIVVEGRFERQDQATRLRLTLIDTQKTREIGYVDLNSPTGDLAALQDEAVTRLSRLMNISIKDSSEPGMGEPTGHAAYENYLTGIGYLQRNDKPGNLDLAITSLENALKTNPNFALGYARLAQAYASKYLLTSNHEWLEEAEKNCRLAARLDDRTPSTYVALGQVHNLSGNQNLAIQEFQRAIDLDPKDPEALSGLAKSFMKAGRNADAEAAYLRAAALRPNDWNGYNDLGIFYESIGRTNEAIAQFARAIKLTPDNAWPYANLGAAYMDFDDPIMLDKADKALTRSIAIDPTFAAYSNLAFLYAEQHRFAESIVASLQALKLNDQDYDVWDNLTAAYEWLKDDRNADSARTKTIELCEQRVKDNPQRATAQAKLAALYAKIGAREKAVDKIHISLALSPENGYVLSEVADAYELLGERTNAIHFLRQAVGKGQSLATLKEDPEIQDLLSDPRFRAPAR